MKKIGWITISSGGYGGDVYGDQVRKVLAKHFDLELVHIKTKYIKKGYLKTPELFFNLVKLKGKKDLWIREDFYPIVPISFDRTRGKNLVIVYHIDSSLAPKFVKPFNFLVEKIVYHNFNKVDAIATVSDYWKNHFLERGYQNVYKVYSGFDLAKFDISEQEVQEFKKKFNLEKKQIVYIGNCQEGKGVAEVYEALKDLEVYLVTSGKPYIQIPALNLNLSYPDYLRLLKASSIAITMSKFKEGWCMTSHEAMLCKTPVIGSGKGGMKELLEGGKQIICQDFSRLREKVKYLLDYSMVREKIGKDGYDFAKNFSQEKFAKEWINLIKKLVE